MSEITMQSNCPLMVSTCLAAKCIFWVKSINVIESQPQQEGCAISALTNALTHVNAMHPGKPDHAHEMLGEMMVTMTPYDAGKIFATIVAPSQLAIVHWLLTLALANRRQDSPTTQRLHKHITENNAPQNNTDSLVFDSVFELMQTLLVALDSERRQSLWLQLKQADPELADKIGPFGFFTFDDLVKLDDRIIQTWLRETTNEELILALKGASCPVREKIMANLSKRAAAMLQDDLDATWPMRKSDIDQCQKDLLRHMRRLLRDKSVADLQEEVGLFYT